MREHNNFDLIRLFAALEVLLQHSSAHLLPTAPAPLLHLVLRFVPPLPIFFIVSGVLVAESFQRSRSLADYARRRIVRIYPCVWLCFAVTLALLAAEGALTPAFLRGNFGWWAVAQLTAGQNFNPTALRSFGVGVVNGSLWTLPLELGFYMMLPVMMRGSPRRITVTTGLLIAVSFPLWSITRPPMPAGIKWLYVLPVTHVWLFALGVLASVHRERLLPLVRARLALWIAIYLAVAVWLPGDGPAALVRYPLYALVILSAAHTAPRLARHLLQGHDVSYGLYAYHMLVVNALLAAGWKGRASGVVIVLGVALAAAILSWRMVERPALAWKVGRAMRLGPPVELGTCAPPPDSPGVAHL